MYYEIIVKGNQIFDWNCAKIFILFFFKETKIIRIGISNNFIIYAHLYLVKF